MMEGTHFTPKFCILPLHQAAENKWWSTQSCRIWTKFKEPGFFASCNSLILRKKPTQHQHVGHVLVDATVPRPWTQSRRVIGPLQKQTSQVPSLSTSCSTGAGGLMTQSTLPAPSPFFGSFKSHCSLRLISLFLYHSLIHPATSEPSVGLSATLLHLQEMSRKRWRGGRWYRIDSTFTIPCVLWC